MCVQISWLSSFSKQSHVCLIWFKTHYIFSLTFSELIFFIIIISFSNVSYLYLLADHVILKKFASNCKHCFHVIFCSEWMYLLHIFTTLITPCVCQLCRHFVSITSWILMYKRQLHVFAHLKMSSLHTIIWMWRGQCPCLCRAVLVRLFGGKLNSDQPGLWIFPVKMKQMFEQSLHVSSIHLDLRNVWHLKCITP